MGKKRTRQTSNGIVQEDSSESDESISHDKSQNSVRSCQHASKSVNQNVGQKSLNLGDLDNNNFCKVCIKLGSSDQGDEIYVCLRCGEKVCSLQHSKAHNSIARSDPHSLALRLSNMTVWCHSCELEVEVSANKKLEACVKNIENVYEKHLQWAQTKNSPKIESLTPEENDVNHYEAVPLLPPKNRSLAGGSAVRGLCNLGNTCFFNSVLQCLARTPNLIETLREMSEPKDVSIELKSGRILEGRLERWDNFCEVLADTLSQLKCGGSAYSPSQLLNLLRRRVPQFRGSDQHDAHELLRHLLDSVRTSDLKRYRRIILNELGLKCVESYEKVDPEKTKELKQMDREVTDKIMLVPEHVFRGFLVSRLECQECKHSSECVETFLDLSLPVSSEKPHPPSFRRKGSPSAVEEKGGSHQMSKHQLKKERKMERKKNRKHHGPHNKKDTGQGESMPSITEKGESDEEGEDGDVDSEESDKKTDNFQENSPQEEVLCAGLPNPPSSLVPNSMAKGDNRALRPGCIPLTYDGVPDISRLSICDSSLPKLQIFVRDSATIAKENPSWRHHLLELSDSKNHLLRNNSNHFSSIRDIIQEKLGNDERIPPEDKESIDEKAVETNVAETPNTELNHRLSDNGTDEACCSQTSEVVNGEVEKGAAGNSESYWDDRGESSYPILENSSDAKNTQDNEEKNSDDEEDMVGCLFDESNYTSADSSGECSVQTCLAQFTGIELMTGTNKVGCETCTARARKKDGKTVYTMSTKQLLIAEAPPVLILHIKRFQVLMSSFRKLGRHVSFPLELDISPFCKKDAEKKLSKKLLYSLYGIVEHSGNINGGHYVAYIKVESGQWFCISDSFVYEVKESKVLQVQAYLLFYKMISYQSTCF